MALFRALVYAALFIGFVLVFLPARLLSWSGVMRPTTTGALQITGATITLVGAVLAVWCVVTFGVVGRGTPAPFDPPRRLVIAGPYRFVRNPMYLGADLVLLGAALYYESVVLAVFLIAFLAITHAFVLLYEEPTLRRTFGAEYDAYRDAVSRWIPHRPAPRRA